MEKNNFQYRHQLEDQGSYPTTTIQVFQKYLYREFSKVTSNMVCESQSKFYQLKFS